MTTGLLDRTLRPPVIVPPASKLSIQIIRTTIQAYCVNVMTHVISLRGNMTRDGHQGLLHQFKPSVILLVSRINIFSW